LSELVYSADVFKNSTSKLEPLLVGDGSASNLGKVVIGTVKNDIHDIGKNIVAALLKGTGFEVIDLGVDVPPERFVQEVKDSGAKALGLSALLSTTYPAMKDVVQALAGGWPAGMRSRLSWAVRRSISRSWISPGPTIWPRMRWTESGSAKRSMESSILAKGFGSRDQRRGYARLSGGLGPAGSGGRGGGRLIHCEARVSYPAACCASFLGASAVRRPQAHGRNCELPRGLLRG
jgi:hypothetical protein